LTLAYPGRLLIEKLAWCYDMGIGVTKDEAEAMERVRKAAEEGDSVRACQRNN
jgi:TPR repeat protein